MHFCKNQIKKVCIFEKFMDEPYTELKARDTYFLMPPLIFLIIFYEKLFVNTRIKKIYILKKIIYLQCN